MKKIIFTTLLLFIIGMSQAAEQSIEFGKISISVEKPDSKENLSASQIDKIQTKVLSVLTANSISGYGKASNFQVLPKYEIYDESIYEGLKNQTIITAELTLIVQQATTQTVYSTYTIKLKGVGNNRDQAIVNSIGQLNSSDGQVKKFVSEAKSKILEYYNARCGLIETEIDKYLSINEYEKALVIAMSIPVEATECYNKIKTKGIEVFKKSQNQICQRILLQADAATAAQNYYLSLQMLSMVDPSSTCITETRKKIGQIETKITQTQKVEWEKTKELLKIQTEREKIQASVLLKSTEMMYKSSESMFSMLLKGLF